MSGKEGIFIGKDGIFSITGEGVRLISTQKAFAKMQGWGRMKPKPARFYKKPAKTVALGPISFQH